MIDVRWAAQYGDGSTVSQFGPDGKERSYESLDRGRLVAFALYDAEARRPLLTVHLEPGQRLVYRRRTEMNTDKGVVEVVHLAGWRQTLESGRIVQAIAYLFASTGRIELAGSFCEGHSWFYAPALRDAEK